MRVNNWRLPSQVDAADISNNTVQTRLLLSQYCASVCMPNLAACYVGNTIREARLHNEPHKPYMLWFLCYVKHLRGSNK